MKRTLLAAAAVACVGLAGCMSIAYDEKGEPYAALQLTTTDSEPKNAVERAADKAVDAAPAIAPFLDAISPGTGQAVLLGGSVLSALGYGSWRGRRVASDKYTLANQWYEDARKEEMLRQAPPTVSPAEVSA